MKNISIYFSIVIGLFLAGCTTGASRYELRNAFYQPYEVTNYYADKVLPENIKRVVFMPINTQGLNILTTRELDNIFGTELQRFGRFEVLTVSREALNAQFGMEELLSTGPYPVGLFAWVKETYRADAIVFVDITHYNAYRPINIGIRGRLVSIGSGKTLWSIDDVLDSGNPHIQSAARGFEDSFERVGYPLNEGTSILKSPLRFSKYVAYVTFQTLPVLKEPIIQADRSRPLN